MKTKLKRVARLVAGGTPTVDDEKNWATADSGLPWVSIGDMSDGRPVESTTRHVSNAGVESKRLPIGEAGTLLFAMYASVGAVGTLGVRASWNQALLGIEAIPGTSDPRFIRYWLEHLKPDLAALSRSNTQDNLNAEQVGNFPFPVMQLAEQRAIADYLDAETARIDALITKKQQLIHLLEERTSLAKSALCDYELRVSPRMPLRSVFRVSKGLDAQRLTAEYCAENPGQFPVLSGQTTGQFGSIDTFDFDAPAGAIVVSTVGAQVMTQTPIIGKFSLSQNCLVLLPYDRGLAIQLFIHQLSQLFLELRASIPDHMQPSLRVEDLSGKWLHVPSDSTQQDLSLRLDSVEQTAKELCGRLHEQIELLVERRRAIITSAVTGEVPSGA